MKSILLLIFLISFVGITQTTETPTKKEQRQEKKEIRRAKKDSLQSLPIGSYFTLDLASAIPITTPRFNLGYIHSLHKNWAVGGSVGFGSSTTFFGFLENYSLWEVRPQLIYNLGKRRRFKHFLSLELFYINHKETLRNRNLLPVNDQNGAIDAISFDRADFKRIKYGVTLNYGEYINFTRRLGLRTTIGGGVRFKDNVYSNLINPRATQFDNFLFTDIYSREGFNVSFQFHLSLQLIYKL